MVWVRFNATYALQKEEKTVVFKIIRFIYLVFKLRLNKANREATLKVLHTYHKYQSEIPIKYHH